jgi:hypothetical protein
MYVLQLYLRSSYSRKVYPPRCPVVSHLEYCTFGMQRLIFSAKYRLLVRGGCSLDPKFAQESESGLRSRQSPAGKTSKDGNCTQSPVY